MEKIAFWNNKGGTGKTSLAFQTICAYANNKPNEKVLVIDVCPQANLSELFLGGLENRGAENLLKRQGETLRATIGGYFQLRLSLPFSKPVFVSEDFLTHPNDFNNQIPTNIDILCGDPILELQSNGMNTLANTQLAGVNTWIGVIDWLEDFVENLNTEYNVVFFDTNPSFSMYTQIALSTSDKMILPVMADDSSKRAIQNVFSLVYGIKLPSEIYAQHAFAERLKNAKRNLPMVHLVIKNRITQYMVAAASAYEVVLKAIENEVSAIIENYSQFITFNNKDVGIAEVRDFNTAGVVSTARGCPFYALNSASYTVLGKRVQVKAEQIKLCVEAINNIANKI